MSYSRNAKPQILEMLAVESIYLPVVVSTEKNLENIVLNMHILWELQGTNMDNYLFNCGQQVKSVPTFFLISKFNLFLKFFLINLMLINLEINNVNIL